MEPAQADGRPRHVPDHRPGAGAGRARAFTCRASRCSGWSPRRRSACRRTRSPRCATSWAATPNDLIEVEASAPRSARPRATGRRAVAAGAHHDPQAWSVTSAARQRAGGTSQITALLAATPPGVDEVTAFRALGQAARNIPGCAELLDHLRDHPDALTSGSAHAPPSLIRLAHALAAAGVPGVVLPGCAGCGKVTADLRSWPGAGLACQSCYQDARRRPCANCGTTGRVAASGPAGPVCGRCYQRDPARQEDALGAISYGGSPTVTPAGAHGALRATRARESTAPSAGRKGGSPPSPPAARSASGATASRPGDAAGAAESAGSRSGPGKAPPTYAPPATGGRLTSARNAGSSGRGKAAGTASRSAAAAISLLLTGADSVAS